MTATDLSSTASPPRPLSFRDVPWRWSDVAIGFLPAIPMFCIALLVSRETQTKLPRWLWIVFASIQLGWMFVYPLWIARRHLGLPPLPSFRRVLIESVIALIAVPIVMVIESILSFVLTKWLGHSTWSTPFEAIAGAPERYQSVALVIVGVVAAPIAEEIFFRGMFFNLLKTRMNFLLAAVLQGAVFGLYHPFGLLERILISVIGFFLALLYQWRKTLAAPILFHALTNALSLGAVFYSVAIAANAPVLGVKGDVSEKGCLILELVPGGAAEEAGIRVGDVITAAGDNSVRNMGDLVLIMRMKQVGDRIPIWFIRDGQDHQVEATLKARAK